ncbi:MAG: AAA family ATPase [Acidobacteria bacterium]|nr:AAA family ATPase [Acidobacteriota bacterium]
MSIETSFPDFYGNAAVAQSLATMIRQDRIPQTLLIAGPEGVGKATLVRRFAAALLGDVEKIEQDDLSRKENVETLAEREKLPSDKRSDDPFVLNSHPDFLTFPPDGPMRQISIQQMRLLKERASFTPLRGKYRVFLIDQIDRANEQAANSLLKILEEPPAHLIMVMTAENIYDLLPTIRSRAVMFHLTSLDESEMAAFAGSRGWQPKERRVLLAGGAPGLSVTLDLDAMDMRRERMMTLLEVASGQSRYSAWIKHSESISASKSEKLEAYLKMLYALLEDVLLVREGLPVRRNPDMKKRIDAVAAGTSFEWFRKVIAHVDQLVIFSRRNVQKGLALDALALIGR